MVDATSFFTVMAALSGAVQDFVDHAIRKRWTWLNTEKKEDLVQENRRQSLIHLITFLVGGGLAYSVGINPLTYLNVSGNQWLGYVIAGLLVSFGGGFFNDALGAVREYKKVQEKIRKAPN